MQYKTGRKYPVYYLHSAAALVRTAERYPLSRKKIVQFCSRVLVPREQTYFITAAQPVLYIPGKKFVIARIIGNGRIAELDNDVRFTEPVRGHSGVEYRHASAESESLAYVCYLSFASGQRVARTHEYVQPSAMLFAQKLCTVPAHFRIPYHRMVTAHEFCKRHASEIRFKKRHVRTARLCPDVQLTE